MARVVMMTTTTTTTTMMMMIVIVTCLLISKTKGHGHMTYPSSSRMNGTMEKGANCNYGECYWFSNNVKIPGYSRIPDYARSVQMNITNGSKSDFFQQMPWRSPGTAPVKGSGCGLAGGDKLPYGNGGVVPSWMMQGQDGITLPPQNPTRWRRGDAVDVAFALTTNHGGGYSWRLCANDTTKENDGFSEACFQSNTLRFASNVSYLAYPDGRRIPVPLLKVTEGTYPAGSEWARNPIPGCYVCDTYETCGSPDSVAPVPSSGAPLANETQCEADCIQTHRSELEKAGCKFPMNSGPSTLDCAIEIAKLCSFCEGGQDSAWVQHEICIGYCDGGLLGLPSCVPGTFQFPEPAPGISGMGLSVNVPAWAWSVMDKMIVPDDISPGHYLLSWRWDCEQNAQVWQNCADIEIY